MKLARSLPWFLAGMGWACAPITSVRLSGDGTAPLEGVPYSLPKTAVVVDVTVTRAPEPRPPRPTVKHSSVRKKTEKKSAAAAEPETTTEAVDTSTVEDAQLAEPAGAAPPARPPENDYLLAFEVRLERIPDPENRFLLRRKNGVFYDDDLTIKVDSRGLLAELSFISRDQTLEVVKKLGELAASVVGLLGVPAALPAGPPGVAPRLGPTEIPLEVRRAALASLGKHRVVSGVRDAAGAESHLLAQGVTTVPAPAPVPGDYAWEVRLQTAARNPFTASGSIPAPPAAPGSMEGVLTRMPEPYRLESFVVLHVIRDQDALRPLTLAATQMVGLFPDFSPVVSVPMRRHVFVRTEGSVMMTDGMVTSARVKKDSEVLAAVGLPVELARQVIALPAQVLQIRIDHSTKQKELIDAEEKLRAAIEARDAAPAEPTPEEREQERIDAEKRDLQNQIDLQKLRNDLEELKRKAAGS